MNESKKNESNGIKVRDPNDPDGPDLELWTIKDMIDGGEIEIDLGCLTGLSLTKPEIEVEVSKFGRALLGDNPSFTIDRNGVTMRLVNWPK